MTKTLNWKYVIKLVGLFLIFEIAFLLISAAVAAIYGDGDCHSFLYTALITAAAAFACIAVGRKCSPVCGRKEGYLTVSLVWVIFSLFGMLPFIFSGRIPSVTDAFFETMSGFTTTGASVIDDIESLPHGLLFWRSIMQWLGGMGIVVLYLAVISMFSAGTQMFSAETPGPQVTKLQPRIKDTARRLWALYCIFTLAETILLFIFGMNIFDALCHSLTTLASGGFSTRGDSIAHWNSPAIDYTVIFFMIISGINFTLMYSAVAKRSPGKLFGDTEFRAYICIIAFSTAVIFISLMHSGGTYSAAGIEETFRDSLFQVVSIITSTGFITTDYTQWQPLAIILLAFLMLFGSCAYSTSGGIKIIRVVVVIKNAVLEFKRMIHPKAIVPVRINRRIVPEHIVNSILAFVTVYLLVIGVSVLLLSVCGMEISESVGAAIASLGNVGNGFGAQGPVGSFAGIPAFAKWYLSFLMLLGRLELFTILLMCTPAFWRR